MGNAKIIWPFIFLFSFAITGKSERNVKKFFLLRGPNAKSFFTENENAFAGNCNVQAKFSPAQDLSVTDGNPVSFTNQSINADTYAWYVNGILISSAKDILVNPVPGVNEVMLIASNGMCVDSMRSFIIRNDGNAGGFAKFKKQYTIPANTFDPYCFGDDKSGNGYLIAGDYFPPATNFVNSCLVRVDQDGCIIWSKTIDIGGEEVIQDIIGTSDMGFLVSAFPHRIRGINYPDSLIIFKLDKDGNIAWSNIYHNGPSISNYLSVMCETDDKGFVLEIGSFSLNGNPSFLTLMKINQLGNFVWARQLGIENFAIYNIGGIVSKNGFIYATGTVHDGTLRNQLIRSFFIQVNELNGQINWSKQNDPAQPLLAFTDLHNYKNGLLLNSYDQNLFTNLVYSDDDGNVLSADIINNPYGPLNSLGNLVVAPDNSIYHHQSSGFGDPVPKDIILKIDAGMQILWQYDFDSPDRTFSNWLQMAAAPSYGVAAIGTGAASRGRGALTLMKLDSAGSLCNSGTTFSAISSANVSLVPLTWNYNQDALFEVIDFPTPFKSLDMESDLFCPKYSSGCDLLKLDGPASVCQPVATLILHKDPACPDNITLIYDSENISITPNAPNQLLANFKKDGTYTIKVQKQGCNFISDSITIKVTDASAIQLPKDTSLCTDGGLMLDAGPGYQSYQWQDGSDQQSIHISATGKYWVTLTDQRGCVHTDTTVVTGISNPPSRFLPADTVICSYEILVMEPRGSFASYQWSTSETTPSIQIKTPGVYTLQVVDKNGCKAEDTMQVATKNCPNSIFFPNAFTPNKDGRNDAFRPVTSGSFVQYHFTVFNRLGQLVFETNDPKKGWDGAIDGVDQPSSVYIWVCKYQFGGEKEVTRKGSFVLIR